MGIARSQPGPRSLEKQTSYDGRDVKQQLLRDFRGKCYLTEECLTLGSITIDHFHPQNEFEDKVYDWNNLFPASHNANNRRPKLWPVGGLLDPSAKENVEGRLIQWLEQIGEKYAPRFAAGDEDDMPAMNTAIQLDHLHNDSSSAKAADLREAITSCYTRVLEEFLKMMSTKSSEDVARCRENIRRMVSRDAPYTMLIRSRLRSFEDIAALFD